MDTLTPTQRSQRMSLVRSSDTRPEMVVRRLVHSMGGRYRLHDRRLPGCPDLVFPGSRKIIFIHGCFWHQHSCRMGNRMPKSRVAFWRDKLQGNKRRDAQQRARLRNLGWRVLVVWECQLQPKKLPALAARLRRFLES